MSRHLRDFRAGALEFRRQMMVPHRLVKGVRQSPLFHQETADIHVCKSQNLLLGIMVRGLVFSLFRQNEAVLIRHALAQGENADIVQQPQKKSVIHCLAGKVFGHRLHGHGAEK